MPAASAPAGVSAPAVSSSMTSSIHRSASIGSAALSSSDSTKSPERLSSSSGLSYFEEIAGSSASISSARPSTLKPLSFETQTTGVSASYADSLASAVIVDTSKSIAWSKSLKNSVIKDTKIDAALKQLEEDGAQGFPTTGAGSRVFFNKYKRQEEELPVNERTNAISTANNKDTEQRIESGDKSPIDKMLSSLDLDQKVAAAAVGVSGFAGLVYEFISSKAADIANLFGAFK
mmetsp:Transcript_29393/g.48144  ORF Transcript_29393/g.48144 Transcript_29393/m.48144 type:complete len:233 (-) Transcript_29393:178-876(-)